MEHRADRTLADVLPSAAAAVGARGFDDHLDLGERSLVVVCLVDGLGATAIEHNSDVFGSLAGARGGSIEAAFPTTTPTGLATLGTGLDSGRHGLVGASFWLPDTEQILSPLHWGRDPAPQAVQPEATVFERARSLGVRTVSIAPAAYEHSGLTTAALRGSDYRTAESMRDRVAVLGELAQADSACIAYVYWAALDRAAHEFGLESTQWLQAARDVDELITELASALPARGALVVTADHGMVDCQRRVWVEDVPALLVGVRAIAGEPRMRHVYVNDPPESVAQRWREELGECAWVMTRHEAIEQGLFGDVDPDIIQRIGDVLALARGGTILASHSFDERVSQLRGHHGSTSDSERRIPCLLLTG